MRGTVAKRIRKQAGVIARNMPSERKFKWFTRWAGRRDKNGNPSTYNVSTARWTGYRRIYQDMKKAYRERKRV